jgi:hypothetical protein
MLIQLSLFFFLARERIELVLDEDSPFLELCSLAGYDQDDMTLGTYIYLFFISVVVFYAIQKKKKN